MLQKKSYKDYTKQLSEEFGIPERIIKWLLKYYMINLKKILLNRQHIYIKKLGSLFPNSFKKIEEKDAKGYTRGVIEFRHTKAERRRQLLRESANTF